jgi:hypothetical protein
VEGVETGRLIDISVIVGEERVGVVSGAVVSAAV